MYVQQTKIIGTIGPSSDKKDVFTKLVKAGLDVARINFSHGTHESNGAAIRMIREVAEETGANVAVLGDLQGPRVRTVVEVSEQLVAGMIIAIVGIAPGEDTHAKLRMTEMASIGFDQPDVVTALKVGHRIFIEDGLKQLVVTDIRPDGIVFAEVRVGGEVKNHKGVNLPDTDVPLPALTDKDEKDLAFMCGEGVDFVALSFVRTAADVEHLRTRIAELVPQESERPRIVVKMERPEAVENMQEIIAATDAVMVARGDLATEAGQERVALLQKGMIRLAMYHMKPVIVATQMLASMEVSPRPTRAEISDVTNAVIDHADATMLSGETAGGDYPVEAVATMSGIIRETEISPYDDINTPEPTDIDEACVTTARDAWVHAREVRADVIVCASPDGQLARALAHFRPSCRVVVLTPHQRVRQQLALVWGVEAYYDSGALGYSADELLIRAGALTGARNIVVAQ